MTLVAATPLTSNHFIQLPIGFEGDSKWSDAAQSNAPFFATAVTSNPADEMQQAVADFDLPSIDIEKRRAFWFGQRRLIFAQQASHLCLSPLYESKRFNVGTYAN